MTNKSKIIAALERHQRKYYPDLPTRSFEQEADPNPRGPHSPVAGNPPTNKVEEVVIEDSRSGEV